MVHGIGQRLEKANLVDDVVDFRRVTANLAERYLTPYQRSTQRVLFIPCQVRTQSYLCHRLILVEMYVILVPHFR